VATTPEACRGLDGRYNPDWPTSSATAAAYNAVVLEADRFRGDQAHRQQALSAVLDKAQLAQLMVTAEDASGRAHLQRGHGCRPAHLRPLALTWTLPFFGYCSVWVGTSLVPRVFPRLCLGFFLACASDVVPNGFYVRGFYVLRIVAFQVRGCESSLTLWLPCVASKCLLLIVTGKWLL